MWAQLCVAVCVGLSSDDEPGPVDGHEDGEFPRTARRPVRSMDDFSGYLTRNGLGSLDVGGALPRLGK